MTEDASISHISLSYPAPSRKKARAECSCCKLHVLAGVRAGNLAGALGSRAPLSQKAFRAASAALNEVSPASPLQVYPSQSKHRLRPKSQPRLSLIRRAALGGHPGKNILPRPCPAAACFYCTEGLLSFLVPALVLLAFPTPETETLPGSTAKKRPPPPTVVLAAH
jgi:hypothetical protein